MPSFFKLKKIIYLFILAELGLCSCVGFSLVAEGGGYSLVVVHGHLVAVVLLWSTGSMHAGFSGLSSCGLLGARARAQ